MFLVCIPKRLTLQNWACQLLTQRTHKTSELAEPAIKLSRFILQMKFSPSTLEICQFLVSTAKHSGQSVPFQATLKERTSGQQMILACPSIPCSGPASHKQQGSWLVKSNCYRVQARSAHCTISQWIQKMRCWGKEETLTGEPSDREDGRFSLVQLLSCVQLFAAPWTAACRLPCPSPTPRAYPNSCPSSWWCHPTISSFVKITILWRPDARFFYRSEMMRGGKEAK